MQVQKSEKARLKGLYTILAVICIVAVCGIVYELLISTAASYLLGDSIRQFSIIIGIYMSSLGIGAWLTKFIKNNLLERFIQAEIALSIIGGSSIIAIFMVFAAGGLYHFVLIYFLTIIIGILVGLEIPLVIRIIEEQIELRENVANVLAFDYIGGLIGSVGFPLFLLPTLGIIKTSLLIGFLNILSAVWLILKNGNFRQKSLYLTIITVLSIILILAFVNAKSINDYLEQNLYKDNIIYSKQTTYQKLVITQFKKDIRLFIDGNLQFSSLDEYRYHESLVHIGYYLARNVENVLILGGGDGLAAREVLKHKGIKSITIVDIDPAMTNYFKESEILTRLNKNSLSDNKVKVINQDAMVFIENSDRLYDLIIIDLPDPRTPELSKLYTKQFYELVNKRLSRTGVMVTQATSPFFARNAFWCIAKTVESVFPFSGQYHVNVLSFGDWGFVLGSKMPLGVSQADKIKIDVETRFLTTDEINKLFIMEKDIACPANIKPNSLFEPVIIEYYKKAWDNW